MFEFGNFDKVGDRLSYQDKNLYLISKRDVGYTVDTETVDGNKNSVYQDSLYKCIAYIRYRETGKYEDMFLDSLAEMDEYFYYQANKTDSQTLKDAQLLLHDVIGFYAQFLKEQGKNYTLNEKEEELKS